jgi:beta-N-acetylhexosaminidase
MTAHVTIPELTGEEPASLSRAATHDLLRQELGYHGLIVTDCLEMEAISGTVGTSDGAVKALQAGADVVMICHRIDRHISALKAAYTALEEGRLNMDELLSSGTRVAHVKAKFAGTWQDVLQGNLDLPAVAELQRAHMDLAKQTYARTTALVAHSTPLILPLQPSKLVHLYVPRSESVNAAVDDPTQIRNTLGPTYAGFGEALERRLGPGCVKLSVYSSELVDPPIVSGAIIFTTQNAHTKTWQVEALQTLLDSLPVDTPVILVSSCGPYDLAMLHSAMEGKSIPYASLATFEFTAPAFEAASEVLFGEHAATGTMPVSLH